MRCPLTFTPHMFPYGGIVRAERSRPWLSERCHHRRTGVTTRCSKLEVLALQAVPSVLANLLGRLHTGRFLPGPEVRQEVMEPAEVVGRKPLGERCERPVEHRPPRARREEDRIGVPLGGLGVPVRREDPPHERALPRIGIDVPSIEELHFERLLRGRPIEERLPLPERVEHEAVEWAPSRSQRDGEGVRRGAGYATLHSRVSRRVSLDTLAAGPARRGLAGLARPIQPIDRAAPAGLIGPLLSRSPDIGWESARCGKR
jgi:hypothetical protein